MSSDIFSRYGFGENEFKTPERKTFDLGAVKDGAVIIFYGPVINKFGKTALYSRTYNFNQGEFAKNVTKVVDSLVDSHGGAVAPIGAGVDPFQQFTFSQKKGMTFEGNILSDNWTFTLSFTGKSNRIRADHLLVTSAIGGLDRTIYTGVCSDVPLINVNGRRILNENCVLEVLHKTKTAINTESGRLGTTYSLNNKNSDWVFNPDLFDAVVSRNSLSADPINHHLSPSKLSQGIREDNGQFYTVPGLSTEIKSGKKVVAAEIADDPKEHLSTVTRGIADFMKNREHSRSVFGDHDFSPAHDELENNADYTSDQLSSFMHLPTSGHYTPEDLDLTKPISLGFLDKHFSLDVHSHTFDASTQYASDSYTDGLIHKLSYELGTIVQIVLNRLGITSMVFAYSSEAVQGGRVTERFRASRTGFIYNVGNEEGRRLRDLAEMELRTGVLRKIGKVLGGDFHVTCRANIADITTIRLNPIGYGVKNTQDFVIPNIMGGLISASVGTTLDSSHNVNRLCELVETFVGSTDRDMQNVDRDQDVSNWSDPLSMSNEPLWADTPQAPATPNTPSPSDAPLPGYANTPIVGDSHEWDKF